MVDPMYQEIKKLFVKFIKNGYFSKFSSADIFYNYFSPKKIHMVTFIDNFFGDSFGFQLFVNDDGFNYVHDIFTTSDNIVNLGDCDSICAVFVSKKDIQEDEKEYVRKNGSKVMKDNNLIMYRFRPGFGKKFVNKKEMHNVLLNLSFLDSLIRNDYNDLIENFNNDLAALSFIDEKELVYQVKYMSIPYLETFPKKQEENIPFVNEFSNSLYYDHECYIFTSYVPMVIKETNVRPLIVYFYCPDTNKMLFNYIVDEPKEYKNCIFGILDNIFSNVGLPEKIYFNNRKIHSIVSKTLDKLNIENSFLREKKNVDDNINEFMEHIYSKSEDGIISSKETVDFLMNAITYALNELDGELEDESDSDEEDNNDDVDTNLIV